MTANEWRDEWLRKRSDKDYGLGDGDIRLTVSDQAWLYSDLLHTEEQLAAAQVDFDARMQKALLVNEARLDEIANLKEQLAICEPKD
jgi:hypothetical protein